MVGTSVFKALSVLGFSHVLTMLLGLASTVAWTRWMPVEMFGQFKVVMGVVSFAGAFCLLGVGQVALMSASGHADGNLVPLLRSKLLANLFGATFILCGAAYYFWMREDSNALAAGLSVAAALFPLYNSNDVWAGWLNGKGEFASLAVGRLLTSGLALCAVLLMVMFNVGSLWLAIAIMLTLLSAQNLLMLGKALRLRANKDSDITLMRFGRHATVAMTFGSLLALDVVFLENFHDAEHVALYAVALALPGLLKPVFGIMGQVISPKIYAANSINELWPSFKNKFYLLTLGFIIVGVIGLFLIPVLLPILFSEKYAAVGNQAGWLWLVISSTGSFSYLGLALLATRRPAYAYIPNVGAPVITIFLWIIFVDYGAVGMVFARCMQAIILAAYYWIAFNGYLIKRGNTD